MENVMDLNSFDTFLALHNNQLKASAVPEHFYKALFEKIQSQLFDGGEVNKFICIVDNCH
jgi:hypothetical protein